MFIQFFIERPIFASVCSMLIVLAGAICIPILPIAQYPDIALPQVQVQSFYNGASAEVVESAVTTPLEQAINGVPGLKYMSSYSTNDGLSQITVTFNLDRNVDLAAVDVQNRVQTVLGRLPQEVVQTGVAVTKNSSAFILVAGVSAPDGRYDNVFISNYVDRYIKDALKRVKGVGNVEIFGERKYSMRLWLDPNRLAARNLTASDVVNALREQNIQVAAGQVGLPPNGPEQVYQFSVRAVGRLPDQAAFDQMILRASQDGSIIRLQDVGHAELGAENYNGFLRFKGRNAVGLGVFQLPNANALETDKLVREELVKLQKSFPPGLDLEVAFDPTTVVGESVNEVVVTLITAILLVVAVIFIFLQDWKSTLIPAITIPVSLVGTFAFMKIFGFSINTLTLFGLTLATGLVVDDAIVVIENIARFVQDKALPPKQAALEGMQEVFGAVIATSLVLIAVFVPVAFFPGTTGQLYKQFALTIAFSIALSAFNAITLTPALSALLFGQHVESENGFFKAVNAVINGVRAWYGALLPKVTKRLGLVMLVFAGCIAATTILFFTVPVGFLPSDDQGYLIIAQQAPEGASVQNTERIMKKVEDIVDRVPGVRAIFAAGGFSFTGAASNKATLFPALDPMDHRKGWDVSAQAILQKIRGPLSQITDALVIPFEPPAIQGVGSLGGFQFMLLDQGNLGIDALANNTFALMGMGNQQKELRGVFSAFTANTPQLVVEVNRDRAKLLGINLVDIFSTLQVFLGSQYVNDFDYLNRIYRVYVQADAPFRSNPGDIDHFYVRSMLGQMVPLSAIVKITPKTAPQVISHYNLFRATEIDGSPAPGFSSGQALDAMERMAGQILPRGMSFEWTGISLEQKESGAQSIFLFMLGGVFVFLVLAAQYESLVDPFIIMLAVPLAIMGALFAQFARGLENDVFCQIGLVMLIGLASKNAILIVEFANQLREKGLSTVEAAIESAKTRFRPIIMTSLAFILGILPLVFASGAGSAARHSLGTAVFGGMMISTALSLFIVPVLYIVVNGLRSWFIHHFLKPSH